MTVHYVELGNVLTRAMRFPAPDKWTSGSVSPSEWATPTTLYQPWGAAGPGVQQVLAASGGAGKAGSGTGNRIALIHLQGQPQACVIGLAGLATTEVTIQAALRYAGSTVAQIKSSDAANLETQLIDVRSRPLDFLVFTGAAVPTAQRLMAGGGPVPRVLGRLRAFYNGPAGEHLELGEVLGPTVDLQILPAVRQDSQTLNPEPTEQALAQYAAEVLTADPELALLRESGYVLRTFAQAFTSAAEHLAGWRRTTCDPDGATPGLACIDLGGRYTEFAVVGGTRASRFVDDLGRRELAAAAFTPRGKREESPPETSEALLVSDIGRWLPYDWSPTGLGDHLANYLKRPFTFPSTWPQLLTAMALGRQRLARARTTIRSSPGEASVSGDWRRQIGMYVVSGGYFRYLPDPALALALAVDGLQPLSVAEIWCDRWGLTPYLAASDQITAIEPYLYLTRLATIVSPIALHLDWRRPHEDDILALVTVERQGSAGTNFRIVPGSLMRFPLRPGEQASLTVYPQRDHDFGAGAGRPWKGIVTGGLLGLVFDTRGRPVALPPDDRIRQAKLREWLNTLNTGTGWEEIGS